MPRAMSRLVEPGAILRSFPEAEVLGLRAAWLAAFGAGRSDVSRRDYLWHVFSAGAFPSLEREEALLEYRKQVAVEFAVMSNDGRTAFMTDVLPERSSLSDFYVFPPNLAWTLAYTHEAGWLGPYFARHADFAALNEANVAQVRKRQAAELARARGWA